MTGDDTEFVNAAGNWDIDAMTAEVNRLRLAVERHEGTIAKVTKQRDEALAALKTVRNENAGMRGTIETVRSHGTPQELLREGCGLMASAMNYDTPTGWRNGAADFIERVRKHLEQTR